MIGAMSGTSADGVDAALVRIDGHGLAMTAQCASHYHRPYPTELRKAIFDLRSSGKADLASFASLGRQITLEYARTIRDLMAGANVSSLEIAAIAAHGQTLFHEPPLTIQWLDPSLLAWETGCAVVSDFRRADCAAGGQGAPLVPFADFILFRHPATDRILLNIGGIANLTYLRAGGKVEDVIAFDTGPGNCISDWICRQFGPPGLKWDVDGAGASGGRVVGQLAGQFRSHRFFSLRPPKSTDGPAMIAAFEKNVGSARIELADLLATAAYVTALTIVDAIHSLPGAGAGDREVFASGGGVYNKAIMGWLRSMIEAGTRVRSITDLATSPDAKEAVAFALLGAATLDGVASNVPSVTGAKRPVVLGSITQRP